ncbi:MAG: HNH endonuclease [Desulfitobacteriaceae bacterium]
MNLSEAFKEYKKATTASSYRAHRAKIAGYIGFVKDVDVQNAFSEKLLREYIFSNTQKAEGLYSALVSLFDFLKKTNNIPSKTYFPITRTETESYDNDNSLLAEIDETHIGPMFLDKKFDLRLLFDDKFYDHLKLKEAKMTAKAAIALGLGAGYDTGDMLYNNDGAIPKMKLTDIKIIEDRVWVKNFYNERDVEYIELSPTLAAYVRDFYMLRKERVDISSAEKEIFLAKIWPSKGLGYDPDVLKQKVKLKNKPYTVQILVYYMLKYISRETGLSRNINVTDLRYNMVLHSLYNTKGSSLKEILKTFEYKNFVQDAFRKYCSENEEILFIFNDNNFFGEAPSEDSEKKSDDSSDGGKKRKEYVINKILRDTKKVRELKAVYENQCQICGHSLTLIEKILYSEACHIQALEHDGIDDKGNLIVLCPNHHKLFDLGIIAIDPENHKQILHIDKNNPLNMFNLKFSRHSFFSICVGYHFNNIFMPLKLSLNEFME